MMHKWVCPKCGHVFKTAVELTTPPQHSHNNGRKYIDMEKLDEQEIGNRVDYLAN
jgi:rubredoxin